MNILPTKLNWPPIDKRWIARPRLISALNQCLDKRATLISAPAGYGKTTLVGQWIDQISAVPVWISLDQHDSDPDRFLRLVITGVRRHYPEFGAGLEPLISSPTLPPPHYLADTLVSELNSLEKPLVVVLDDFHTIASEPVPAMLARIIQYLPDMVHLVIVTRVDPPLPLAQWRVRNWLEALRAADLGFSLEEAQEFFTQAAENTLSNGAIERIHDRTEGWAAGLLMTRVSLSGTDDPERIVQGITNNNRLVIDFFMDEVIAAQSEEILDFLALTSIFDRFCASLCDFIQEGPPGMDQSRKRIEQIEKENLFLIPLDNEGTWYRYHYLFKNIVELRLKKRISPERKNRILQRAGTWFARQGLIEEALRHLIAADDLDAAVVLIEENLDTAIDKDLSRQTLGRWLDMFPKSAEKRWPVLLVAHAYRKMFNWDLNGMRPLMDDAEALLNRSETVMPESRRQKLIGDIDAQRGFYFYWQGDVDASLRHAIRAMNVSSGQHPHLQNIAIVYSAGSYAMDGRRDRAFRLLDEAIAKDCSRGSLNAGTLLTTQAAIHFYAGELADVRKSANQLLANHETVQVPGFWLGHAHYFLGCVAYEQNRLDIAASHFEQMEKMRYILNTRIYHEGLIGLAFVALARGNVEAAREYTQSARRFAIEMSDAFSLMISDSFETRVAMLSGEVLVEQKTPSTTSSSNHFWLEVPSLTRAEYLIGKATPADCHTGLELIEEGLKKAREHHNTRQEIQFQAAKAVALKRAGRPDEALIVLTDTLRMAKPLGFVRTFLDRGPAMADLLQNISTTHLGNRHIKSFLDEVEQKRPTGDKNLQTVSLAGDRHSENLTNRELDVLVLLAERLSNKEIADRLFISPITVKRHTANIYRKLNVHSRRQAVAEAYKRNLVPMQ